MIHSIVEVLTIWKSDSSYIVAGKEQNTLVAEDLWNWSTGSNYPTNPMRSNGSAR